MNALDLLQRLRELGVSLKLDGDRLRIQAPAGVLTDELKAALGTHKPELIALLSQARSDAGAGPPLVRASRDGDAPLSFAQQRLWFLDQLVADGSVSNLALALELDGPLDVAALRGALDDLAARHESLRTRFEARDGVPHQVIGAPGPVALEVVPVESTGESEEGPRAGEQAEADPAGADRLAKARRQLQAWRAQPFDLGAGPPWRARLLKLSDTHHVLGLVLHHMVYDGWSLGVALRDLEALYTARVTGAASGLPALPVDYADYALWQRRALTDDTRQQLLDHWRGALQGATPLELPTDHPRGGRPAMRCAVHTLQLPAELSTQLTQLGRNSGATLFMTLLAAFKALLARCCGQDDIVVGSPVAGRTRAELEELVGPFLNMVVLRTSTAGNPTCRELLARVSATCLDAWAHQQLPFEQVVEALAPERDRSRNPLFQVNFVVQNAPAPGRGMQGLTTRPLPVPQETSLFDLSVEVWERPDGLAIEFIHDVELFETGSIAALARAYRTVLEAWAANPELHVDELPLVSADDRRELLVDANRTDAALPEADTLHGWVEAQVAATPDAVALECEGETLTYAALDRHATRLADQLSALGAATGTCTGTGPGTQVGLCLERGLPMMVAALGILKSGSAYVPLDPAFPQDRLAYMLADCGARVLVTQPSLRGLLPDFDGEVVLLDAHGVAIAEAHGDALPRTAPTTPPDTQASPASPDDRAYVIYTSGSTGRPKGVCIPHRAVVNFLASMTRQPGLAADDVLLAVTTLSFDIAGLELFGPLGVGGKVVIAPTATAADGERLGALLSTCGATVCQATPTTWQLLLQSGWRDPSLKMLCGGEALPRSLADRLLTAGGALWNMYGPTETTIWSLIARMTAGSGRVPIGRPIDNTQVYVLDAQQRPVPQGVPGELYLGGTGVAEGYLGRPELTAERFVADPFAAMTGHAGGARNAHTQPANAPRMYRTGDLVRRRADGQLEFVRRLDTQVKLRGYRIELGEIESALGEHPDVAEAAVALREDVPGDKRLVGYVTSAVADAAAAPTADTLRAWLADRLPPYMAPSAWLLLDDIPRTPNRKIDRNALPAPGGARELGREYEAPATDLERVIAEVWRDLLRVERVGRQDGFFELGGHSLTLMQARARLSEQLGREIPLSDLFDFATLAGLAERLADHQRDDDGGAPRADSDPVDASRRAAGANVQRPIVPVPRGEDVPLSFAQQRLWFLDQLEAGAAYNLSLSLELEGALDVATLQAALDALVARHDTLRTSFPSHEGKPRQHIDARVELPLAIEELHDESPEQTRAALSRLARRDADTPFDLARAPLLRATLARVGARRAVLFLTVHHIVSDGWSLQVLHRELQELYRAQAAGESPRLPELSVQYADWAAWQAEQLRGDTHAALLDHWRTQLAGELTTLRLPLDRPRPARQTFGGAAHGFAIPASLVRALHTRCTAWGVTPAMVLLAAFDALLARDSGQDEVILGSPVANRMRPEVEPLIGFFVNAVVLRTDLSGDPTFEQLVRRAQAVSLAAYEHQDLPFEHLVNELQPERSLSHNPLFQVVFSMQNAPTPDATPAPGELVMRARPPQVSQTHTDMELHLLESAACAAGEADLDGWLVFNTGLFDRGTIERMATRFVTLLGGALAEPGQHVSELPVLEGSERRTLLETWNDTAAPVPPVCLHELIEVRAAQMPQHIAVVHGDATLTYGDLDARANQVAHVLRERGVVPDTLVGLCVGRGHAMIIGLLGILKAGGAYVPMDPSYPLERLAFMLEDSAVTQLVTTADVLATLPPERIDAGVRALCLDRDAALLDAAPTTCPQSGVTPDHLAYAIYTSGSTGTPKAALLQHRGIVSLSEAQRRMFGVTPDDRVLQFSSLSFDAATFEIVMALPKGATLCLGDRGDLLPGPDLAAFLVRHEVSLVTLTPTALAALPSTDLPALRTITVAGEACSPELVARWAPGRRFFNLYGPTETTIWATAAQLRADVGGAPIGKPIDNAQAYVLDEHRQPAPVGVPGELYLGGLGLARGYLQRRSLTAERFVRHPFDASPGARLYRTGDRARWRPDGQLEFLGRLDHQIKLRGHRIELGEIEATLDAHPAVRESLALVREDTPGSRRLVAYVVADGAAAGGATGDGAARDGATRDAGELVPALRQHAAARLPEFMVPAAFVVLDAFPVTPNGKLDRDALPAPDAHRPELAGRYVAPRTEAQETLARLWADVLKVERVGIADNFFELGGDSMLSIQLVAAARKAGLVFRAHDLFGHQTVEELAAVATGGAGAGTDTGVAAGAGEAIDAEQGVVTGVVPLTPIQHWFLDDDPVDAAHFSQAFHLECLAAVQGDRLREALGALARHHDALRLRFVREGGAGDGCGWRQEIAAPGDDFALEVVELAGMTASERDACRATTAERTQASLDLTEGPLARAVLFRGGEGAGEPDSEPDTLLLVVHHLAIDAVSWRLLLEDLTTLLEDPAATLPAKTTSWAAWSRRLVSHAATQTLANQARSWLQMPWSRTGEPPLDVAAPPVDADTVARTQTHQLVIDRELTDALLHAPRVDELLITALARALADWQDADFVRLDLEGHGREELPGVDLSRTVGWFTSLFPVALEVDRGASVADSLTALSTQLRRLPERGLPFGVARSLSDDDALRAELIALPPAHVAFNYLGQLGSSLDDAGAFRRSQLPAGAMTSAAQHRHHWVEVNAAVLDGFLTVDVRFSAARHRRVTIERLTDDVHAGLRAWVEAGGASASAPAPPSDVRQQVDAGTFGWDAEDLEDMLGELPDS